MSDRSRKMIVQDISEASSKRPMTTCTTGLAFTTNLTIDSSFSIVHLYEIRKRSRPKSLRIDAGHPNLAFGESRIAPRTVGSGDHLPESDRSASLRHGHAGNRDLIIEPRRAAVVHLNFDDGEHKPELFGELLLGVTQRAQPLGSRALHELEVVGVVNDASAIGVFPIDA